MNKVTITQGITKLSNGADITEVVKHKFIFYFTTGKDILLLTRNDNIHEASWGFSSMFNSMRRHVESVPTKNAQSFAGSIKNVAVFRAISKGRIVYTANTMKGVLRRYKEVA